MKKVTIVIETENAAFSHFPVIEIEKILKRYMERCRSRQVMEDSRLLDHNGNTVGSVTVDR